MPNHEGREVERLIVTNDRLWTVVVVLLVMVAALLAPYTGLDVATVLRIFNR